MADDRLPAPGPGATPAGEGSSGAVDLREGHHVEPATDAHFRNPGLPPHVHRQGDDDPAAAKRIIDRDRVTVFLGVPTMYVALLRDPDPVDASSLRIAVSGGAPLPVEVLHEF